MVMTRPESYILRSLYENLCKTSNSDTVTCDEANSLLRPENFYNKTMLRAYVLADWSRPEAKMDIEPYLEDLERLSADILDHPLPSELFDSDFSRANLKRLTESADESTGTGAVIKGALPSEIVREAYIGSEVPLSMVVLDYDPSTFARLEELAVKQPWYDTSYYEATSANLKAICDSGVVYRPPTSTAPPV
jgi:hypothetical protein